MLTLLQINATSNWGSTGKIAEQIGLCAATHGWKSYIAYGRMSNPSKNQLVKIGSALDTYEHYLEGLLFDNEGLASRRATKKFLRHIAEIKPNVVHLHNIHDHYLNYKLLFEYLNTTSIKVVWTFHDFWPVTGHCMHFVSKSCEKYRDGCSDCPMKSIYPKTILDFSSRNFKLKKKLFAANRNLHIVTVSQWVADMVKLSFLGDKPIRVISNGVDLNVFKPTSVADIDNEAEMSDLFDRIEDKFVILSVASQWKHDKGLDDYVKMSSVLDKDEIIVLVGVDEQISKNLPNNIIGIKHTNNAKELAALYSRADVVTVLSSAETFGLTVVEGYACGTPAVVYNNTAPPALITKETGLVANNGDYMAAYEAIRIIKNKGKIFYSDSCINFVAKKYNKDKCFEKYVQLYNDITLQDGSQESWNAAYR